MDATSKKTLRYPIILALAASLLVLPACGGTDKPAEANPSGESSPSASASAGPDASEAPVANFLAPLTGLPSVEEVTKRPLSVMINNYAAARPQSGLTQADTVWEVLAEGGITRLVAIFQSKSFTDPIGPIRSIRPYLIDIGESYGGVLVHAGASNDALALLQHSGKADLDEINNAGAYFYREKSRKAPHNLYSTLEMLREGAAKRKFDETADVPLVTFSPQPDAASAATASQIEVKFQLSDYKVEYAYDAATGLYARSINGEPHIDLNNGEQLKAANLVVFSTKHRAYDDVGRLEIDLNSGGKALLFQQGHVIECTWERTKGDIVRLTKDGKELPFVPGVTYYHVVPNSDSLENHVTYR
ncbi:DUF3048 domain-containing protein [Cohnella thailandensis]|uniref:DUF3048 domain-containing protein n=1 Tax=Cohnella thailandensis TaxID=557557 RepID=A0A841T4J5_9BACL|nr:DUF3048 domain-containing protein [Cohnella thailandensis]MBB6636051.1 DUF3048 domain-containing protein [Cohnella thailandensis]MBP1976794.1 hypothetical protein [Cohnella thailandensis]